MNYEEYYLVSKKLERIVELAKLITGTHLFRVCKLADGSQKGMQCTYAQISSKLAVIEEASFLDYLKDNIDIVSPELIQQIEVLFENSGANISSNLDDNNV
jgi:hypothetical protein